MKVNDTIAQVLDSLGMVNTGAYGGMVVVDDLFGITELNEIIKLISGILGIFWLAQKCYYGIKDRRSKDGLQEGEK